MTLRIALIDDSDVALEWVCGVLRPFGVEVFTYNSSLGIQAFVRRANPNLVMLDVNMPALNGDIVCKMLKARKATKDVLVALYSSMPENELLELVDSCGADGFVSKTADVEVLIQQIETVLGHSLQAV